MFFLGYFYEDIIRWFDIVFYRLFFIRIGYRLGMRL